MRGEIPVLMQPAVFSRTRNQRHQIDGEFAYTRGGVFGAGEFDESLDLLGMGSRRTCAERGVDFPEEQGGGAVADFPAHESESRECLLVRGD